MVASEDDRHRPGLGDLADNFADRLDRLLDAERVDRGVGAVREGELADRLRKSERAILIAVKA